jgi:membrane-associated phospholipid phosphatase
MSTPTARTDSVTGDDGRATTRRDGRTVRRRHLLGFPLRWADVRWFLGCYVLFSAVGVGLGMLIVHPLRHSWLQHVDESIERWLAGHRTSWLNSATFVGSELADTVVKITVTVVVAIMMLVVWRRWLEPLMVALALVLEASVFITVTWIVGRPRPAVPRLEGSPVGSSFPSGHVAAAVTYGGIVVVVFWRTRRHWARVLGVAVVALIASIAGFSRMYRGMHHLSDVVSGAALGLVAVLATRAILLRTVARRAGEQPVVAGEPPRPVT